MRRIASLLLFLAAVSSTGLASRQLLAEAFRADRRAAENGDVDGSGKRDHGDAVYLLRFLVLGGPAPVPLACPVGDSRFSNGDANGDGRVDLKDFVRIVLWLIGEASEPVDACRPASAVARGREIWLKNTYGGEKFFWLLANASDPAQRIDIGFRNVVETPREERFDRWGVINDPDCHADPNGGPDICDDPNATGVVGIRKFPGPGGTTIYGVACASCHAGLDPIHPPRDPNLPEWKNIHLTIGNKYLKSGALFGANLPAGDPRAILFAAWPPGTVDTTLLFNDGIMNPGIITQIWELKHRRLFDAGVAEPQLRNAQGGEDDLGLAIAARRVYTNIGVCFQECVAEKVAAGLPIDIAECVAKCPDFPPDQDMRDLAKFLFSVPHPAYPGRAAPARTYERGRKAFESACAGCHSTKGELKKVLSNDEVNLLRDLGENAPNACRALTTNWDAGHIWAEFSPSVFKARGGKGYRTLLLSGIWSVPPYLHNNSVGVWAPPAGSPEERATAYRTSMRQLLSRDRPPVVFTLPVQVGPFPAGTPLSEVFSRAPDGTLLCDDFVENHGHYYGADLSAEDKEALITWLLYQ
jgi:cytochrome c5